MRIALTGFTYLLALLGGTGCLYQNMSPATKLRDSVEAGNEGARWARMDIALERVAPEYLRDYLQRHHDWGDGIQMADLDILRLEMAEDSSSATVTVRFGWYAYDTMALESTVVLQSWRSTGSGYFVLTGERIVDGDDRLLEPPPEPEPQEEQEEELAEDEDSGDGDDGREEEDWIDSDDEEATDDPGVVASAT